MMLLRDKVLRLSWTDLAAGGVLVLICVLASMHAWHSEFTYPDAARHAMDGVFVHDFLRSANWSTPWEYALSYYGRYPSVAFMLYYPPGYALYEVPFIALFGVGRFAAVLASVTCLCAFAVVWYLWISRLLGRWTGFLGTALAVGSVVFVRWAGESMLEIPALFLISLVCLLYTQFLLKGKSWRLLLAGVVFGLAVETKQTSGFLLPALVVVPFVMGGRQYFRWKNTLAALGLFALMVIPVGYVTLVYGPANLAAATGQDRAYLASVGNWTAVGRFLATTQVGPVVALLGLAGAVLAIARRNRRALFLVLFCCANWVAFSLVAYKSSRLSMYWVPAVCTLAVYGVVNVVPRKGGKGLGAVVLVLLIVFQSIYLHKYGKFVTVRGYREAAMYVCENTQGSQTVLVQAYHNGNFIFHVREFDPAGRIAVLRASKILYSSAVMEEFGTKVFYDSEREIRENVLDRLGTRFVVVENRPVKEEEDNRGVKALRRLVRGEGFALRKVIPVEGSEAMLGGLRLEVYEYLSAREITDGFVEFDLMSIGRKVKVPLKGSGGSR